MGRRPAAGGLCRLAPRAGGPMEEAPFDPDLRFLLVSEGVPVVLAADLGRLGFATIRLFAKYNSTAAG
eukprot:1967974-Lingulodinium_polyedra.AAC.1